MFVLVLACCHLHCVSVMFRGSTETTRRTENTEAGTKPVKSTGTTHTSPARSECVSLLLLSEIRQTHPGAVHQALIKKGLPFILILLFDAIIDINCLSQAACTIISDKPSKAFFFTVNCR